MPISMNPDTHVEGGGAGLSDGIYTILTSKVVDDFDYGGKQARFVALSLTALPDGGGDPVHEHLPFGLVSEGWIVVDDGKGADNSQGKGLNRSSNLSIFMDTIRNAGFPADKLGADWSVLEGLKAEFKRLPIPGSYRRNIADGTEKAKTCVQCMRIVSLPGEGSPAGEAPASDAGAVELIRGVLAEAGGSMPTSKLLGASFQKAEGAQKKAVTDLLQSEAAIGQHFDLKDGVVIQRAT